MRGQWRADTNRRDKRQDEKEEGGVCPKSQKPRRSTTQMK